MSNKTAAILAGAAILVGVLIGRASANTSSGTSTPKPAPPALNRGLDPKTYPRTKEGAATAAQAYDDALIRAVFMTAEERRGVIDAISSAAMRDQIAKDEEQAASVATRTLDLPKDLDQVVRRTAPLGWRVVSFTRDSARVELWNVAVAGKPSVDHGVTSGFITKTVELAFERGAWRLAGNPAGKEGPTPIADNAQASSDLLNATKDLQEFTHEARG